MQVFADVRDKGPDRGDRRFELPRRFSQFAYPMPHFGGRVDIDTCAVGWAEQAGVIGGHCNRAATPIASAASAGTTTGGTNQLNIDDSPAAPQPA